MCHGASIGFDSKLNRIAHDPPVDIMLFGNSRILAVGTEEIGLKDSKVFNAGSGGTSFRQSVAALERVVATGRAPRVAVLSFDNVSLLYAQGDADWPPPPLRWSAVLGDALALPGAPYRLRSDMRSFAKAVVSREIDQIADLVNINFLWPRLQVVAGATSPCQTGYRADGSRPLPKPVTADLNGGPLPDYSPLEARYPLLEHDLDRLAAIQARGVKVVVYESPLLPAMEASVGPQLPEEQLRQRQRLQAGCLARGLTYHSSPILSGSETDGYWEDFNHAPPRALGRFIAGLVQPFLDHGEAAR